MSIIENNKIALLVLGMHRSGTSAMAGLLGINGAGLPDDLMPAAADNPEGFFESLEVASLNDEILAQYGSVWDDVFSGAPGQCSGPIAETYYSRATALIAARFENHPIIALKDPRISLLSGFWRQVLRQCGYDPRYILMVRNPLEVAQSLTVRNGFSREKGLLLWSSYSLACERDTRGEHRVFVSYQGLSDDWRGTLDRIESALKVKLPKRTAATSVLSDRFVQGELRHHIKPDPAGLGPVWDATLQLYDWAMAATRDAAPPGPAPLGLDRVLLDLQSVFGPVLAEANEQIAARDRAIRVAQSHTATLIAQKDAQIGDVEGRLSHLNETIAGLENSVREQIAKQRPDGEVSNLNQTIAGLEESVREQVAKQNAAVLEINQARAIRHDLDRAFAYLNQELHQTQIELGIKAAELDGLSADLGSMTAELETVTAEKRALSDHLAAQDDRVRDLRLAYAQLEVRHNSVIQSTSWRLMGPVRRLLSGHPRVTRTIRGLLRPAYRALRFGLLRRGAAAKGAVVAFVGAPVNIRDEAALAERAPNWPHGWPLAQNPKLPLDSLAAYDRRIDDQIVYACEAGRAFFEAFNLGGPGPRFSLAVDALNQKSPAGDSDPAPDVSIIIPAYGQLAYTLNCLDSLIAHQSRYRFEILVGDDCSPDETGIHLPEVKAIRYIRHDANLGFIGNCNAVAERARGQYIVMLNNDTRVADGWLDELIGSFALFPKAGLVGSKLFYPDASLQEAGGMVWQDGSAWNYGRNDDPNRPAYGYARQVDYVSGAAIALPRALWQSLGGFDEIYKPAYYEDTDLAFRVRTQGLEVYMQPLSRVVHYEGITSGTDIGSGTKAYQAVNRLTFLERWKDTLAGHRPNGQEPMLERERQIERRVLMIDVTAPTPNQDAGSVVVMQIIAVFQKLGFKVTYLPLDNWLYQPAYLDPLRRAGVECVCAPFDVNLNAYLVREGHMFDVVHVFRFQALSKALASIKRHAPQAKLVFNNQDLHYLRVSRQAEVENSEALRREAKSIKAAEIEAMNGADVICTLSSVEKSVLDAESLLKKPVAIVPYMIDLPQQGPGPGAHRKDILFLGGYGHSPNIDAAEWLVRDIWPLVKPHLGDARLILAGANPTQAVLDLAGRDIEVPGRIEDLDPLFERASVFVAPLRYGAGVKGKIYSAFGYGLPVVTTSVGAEGMGLTSGQEVLIADEARDLADAILRLASEPDTWAALASKARAFVEANHTVESGARVMAQLLGDAP